jgi:hypothetical protein
MRCPPRASLRRCSAGAPTRPRFGHSALRQCPPAYEGASSAPTLARSTAVLPGRWGLLVGVGAVPGPAPGRCKESGLGGSWSTAYACRSGPEPVSWVSFQKQPDEGSNLSPPTCHAAARVHGGRRRGGRGVDGSAWRRMTGHGNNLLGVVIILGARHRAGVGWPGAVLGPRGSGGWVSFPRHGRGVGGCGREGRVWVRDSRSEGGIT